jgi:hypothetical protein
LVVRGDLTHETASRECRPGGAPTNDWTFNLKGSLKLCFREDPGKMSHEFARIDTNVSNYDEIPLECGFPKKEGNFHSDGESTKGGLFLEFRHVYFFLLQID